MKEIQISGLMPNDFPREENQRCEYRLNYTPKIKKYDFVKQGEVLYSIELSTYNQFIRESHNYKGVIYAPIDAFYILPDNEHDYDLFLLSNVVCFESEDEVKECIAHQIQYSLFTDPFTKTQSVNWSLSERKRKHSDSSYIIDRVNSWLESKHGEIYFVFAPKYVDNNTIVELSHECIVSSNRSLGTKNLIKLNDISKYFFLFEDESVLTLSCKDLEHTNSTWKWEMKALEIKQFANSPDKALRVEYNNAKTFDQEFVRGTALFVQQHFIAYAQALTKLGYDINEHSYLDDSPAKEESECFVYLMHDTKNGYYKIGISNRPKYRERTLQSEKPSIELVAAKEFPTRVIAESIESALHRAYKEKRLRGEWFNLTMKEVHDLKQVLQ